MKLGPGLHSSGIMAQLMTSAFSSGWKTTQMIRLRYFCCWYPQLYVMTCPPVILTEQKFFGWVDISLDGYKIRSKSSKNYMY